jgi:hypothetical protein
MKLWVALYAMIWIVLIEFLLAMTPGGSPVLIYLHVVSSFAIITQAAAVAIAYDMWEDNEFVKETEQRRMG